MGSRKSNSHKPGEGMENTVGEMKEWMYLGVMGCRDNKKGRVEGMRVAAIGFAILIYGTEIKRSGEHCE